MSDELAKILMVSKPAITKTIHQMQDAGLVEVVTNDVDRRSKKLFLTPLAEDVLSEINPILKDTQEKILSGFSEKEIETFENLLDKVYENIK